MPKEFKAKRVYWGPKDYLAGEVRHYEYRGFRIERGLGRPGYWDAWRIIQPGVGVVGDAETLKEAERRVDRHHGDY